MFPDEPTLIARGKVSTLNKERREQLERVQGICNMIVTEAQAVLKDCHAKPPVNQSHLENLGKCIDNLYKSRERLITVGLGLNEYEPEAWPK